MPELSADLSLGLDTSGSSRGGTTSGTPKFSFRAGFLSGSDLEVAAFQGREEISGCYSFDVLLAISSTVDETLFEPAVLGQPAILTIDLASYVRTFHGVVASFKIEGMLLRGDRWAARLRLVPRMWLLRRRKNSRVFQNQTVDETVNAVLAGAGISRKWSLQKPYPRREYCVQYEETDYQFVTRLLAEAGISFYFEQPPAALDQLLGDVETMAETAIGAASMLGGPIADAASSLESFLPKETVVFFDSSPGTPGIDTLDGDEVESIVSSVVSAVVTEASSAISSEIDVESSDVTASMGALASVAIKTASPKLYYQTPDSGVTGEDVISEFSLTRKIRSKSAMLQTHDPSTPSVERVARASTLGRPGSGVEGMISSAVSAAVSIGSTGSLGLKAKIQPPAMLDPHKLEVFEHHHEYMAVQWKNERAEGNLLLNQLRRRVWAAQGSSGTARVAAGRRFTLADHVREPLNQEYLITRVEHEGTAPAQAAAEGVRDAVSMPPAYRNRFEAVPSATNYCPKRPPRRVIQSCETAIVVGPAGEEIHVNEHGHIKIQFHWDRLGTRDDHSSCWVRAMQNWAGPQWGTQFIPRIGMEVVVAFEGGDPDRPIVVGCVYHQSNPTPFELPAHKTRSGIRTQSSPGGNGFNELSFEDARGNEQIYLHAQRDHDEVVENDHTLRVGHDETLLVEGEQKQTVRGDRTDHVVGKFELEVEGERREKVQGAHANEVGGNDEMIIGGDQSTSIGGTERRSVLSAAEHSVEDDFTVRTRGCFTTLVGRADAKRNYHLHVEGRAEINSMDVTELSATKSIIFRCGKSTITVGPDHIELVSPTIVASGGGGGLTFGDGKATIRATGQASVFGDKILLKASGSNVGLGSNADVKGAKIRLNAPTGGSDEVKDDSPTPTKIELQDQDGKALPYQRFSIKMDDDSMRSGITDKDGKAELFIEGEAKISFPDVAKTSAS